MRSSQVGWGAGKNGDPGLLETDLCPPQLVEFLDKWHGSAATLPGRMEELMVALYERDYVELLDVELTQAWFEALIDADYPMPALIASASKAA